MGINKNFGKYLRMIAISSFTRISGIINDVIQVTDSFVDDANEVIFGDVHI